MISMFSKAYYKDRWKGGSVQRTRAKALFRHHRHRRAQQGGAGKPILCTITKKPQPSACSAGFYRHLPVQLASLRSMTVLFTLLS